MAITVEAETQKSDHSVENSLSKKKEEHQAASSKRRPNPTHHPRERTVVRTINSLHKAPIVQMIEKVTSLRLVAGLARRPLSHVQPPCVLPRSKLRLNLCQRKVNTRGVARRLVEVSSFTLLAGVRAAAFHCSHSRRPDQGCNPIILSSLLMSRIRLASTVPGILALNH